MNTKSILLSSKGLKNIIWNNYTEGNEFSFKFGEKVIKTNNILAEFISPTVSHLHLADPTIKSIDYDSIFQNFQINNSENASIFLNEEIFSHLDQLMKGNSIEISEDQSFKLRLISIIFDNEELFKLLEENFPITSNESKIDFCIQQLQLSQYFQKILHTSSNFTYSSIIDFIADNFYSIDKNKLLSLTISTLHSIISNEHLLIETEDLLLDFIEKVFQTKSEREIDSEFDIFDFYELIEIHSLSDNKFQEFVLNININRMTTSLWTKLRQFFFITQEQRSSKTRQQRYTKIGESFEYDGNESNRFNGIIRHLTKESGGNVSENGTVKVTASSTQGNNQEQRPKFAVDFDDFGHYFHSNNEKNSWLQFDFGERKIRPTKYSIRSRHDHGKLNCNLKNWVIEGSNTGKNGDWKTLDTRNDVSVLDDKNASYTFNIKTTLDKNEFFRYLRIRITGPDTGNYYHLVLSALEYFGSIQQPS